MNELNDKLRDLTNQAADRAPDVLFTIVIGFIIVEIAILILSRVLWLSKIPVGLRGILETLGRTFLWIVLFLVIIQTLGLNNVILALTGSSVIVALFLSTGVAPMVSDILAGLFLASNKEFQPGCRVRAGDKQTEGVIEGLDLKKVLIRDDQGRIHVIPNSMVEKNEWVILKPRPDRRRIHRSTKRRK